MHRGICDVIPTEERSRLPVAFLAGLAVVALLIGIALVINHYSNASSTATAQKPLPWGPTEQAYAPQIHFLEPKMSRAANFLNQEVTFIFGTVENGGNKNIHQIEVTLEFHDVFNQVVLRDKERLFPDNAPRFKPGEQRDFQLSFEAIPEEWNMVYPTIHVTGIAF